MRTYWTALKLFLILSLLTGIVYPLLVTLVGSTFFSRQAHGSLVFDQKAQLRGSALLAQGFEGPRYFWPRPSAIDYDGRASGGSNLGPTSQALVDVVRNRVEKGSSGDLVFASGSGLDPEIRPVDAYAQIDRIASARGLPQEAIRDLVKRLAQDRQWGFLGEARVNVLKLNLELDGTARGNAAN